MMSEVAGRAIEAAQQTLAQWAATFPGTEHEQDLLERMFAHYDRHGFAGSSRVLSALLRREPRRLRGSGS